MSKTGRVPKFTKWDDMTHIHMMSCLLCRSQFVYQTDVASFFHPHKYRPIGGSKTVAKSKGGHVIWSGPQVIQRKF